MLKLLQPGHISNVTIKNRVIMAAMGVSRLESTGGDWGEGMLAYYRARAEGGTGMITTHSVFISQALEPFTRNSFNLYSDDHLASLRKIVECLHQHDCKLCVQLTAGFGRVTMRLTPEVAPVSASENRCDRFPQITARALSTAETEALALDFGRAALRCREAGADCVEMHGHEGYLLDQFMTGLWNRRQDKYGGDREKRLTFTRESIEAIRRSVGEDFPIIYRIGVTHYLPGGRDLEEGLWIVSELEKMGVDALHVDAGGKENSWWPHPPIYQPPGCMLDLAEKVKQVVKVPVIAVGRLDRPPVAEQALNDGRADFIAIGRGLLADPAWVNKVDAGQEATIIPCIGCHDGCLGAMIHQRPIGCSVNPLCGHEVEWRVTPIQKRKSLLVVGGGPAGIEAARLGVERGFEVNLWEQSERLGGNLWAAGRPDFKQDIRDYIAYLKGLMGRLPVEVRMNFQATPENIRQAAVDYVLIATGAQMGPPLLTGEPQVPLISAYDVMRGAEVTGERVLIMGAGVIGCETALYLARLGKRVTLAFTFPDEGLAENLEVRANRDMLIDMVREAGVSILTRTVPSRLEPRFVVAERDAEVVKIPADVVVHASLMLPDNELLNQLVTLHPGVLSAGDCVKAGGIIDAVWGAFQTVRQIET